MADRTESAERLDLDALEKLALTAEARGHAIGESSWYCIEEFCGNMLMNSDDAGFSAAVTPIVVLTLIARIRELESRAPAEAPEGWHALTDEDRQAAFESLPDMLEGFMKKWGWLHFSKEIERRCREKNAAAPASPKQEKV